MKIAYFIARIPVSKITKKIRNFEAETQNRA